MQDNKDASHPADYEIDSIMSRIGVNHALFLNNLELWIDGIISKDGMAQAETIRKIKDSFERAIMANIDHHQFMADNSEQDGDQFWLRRHALMVEIYRSLLPR